jgi:hypothetical protein
LAEVQGWLHRLYVAEPGARLRAEDLRKAVEVAALLEEVERALGRASRKRPFTLVDAAAGKAYAGLLAAKLVLGRDGRDARVLAIEREPGRVALSRAAAALLDSPVPVECVQADVADRGCWPQAPSLVVALHACGGASDAVIAGAVASGARALLLVPCCTGGGVAAAGLADALAETLGVPRHAAVRRRFIQSVVDAERTWRLEAAGYETEVVEMVAPTVTPHNLLWRARRVGEPGRMARARAALERLAEAAGAAAAPAPRLGDEPPWERR